MSKIIKNSINFGFKTLTILAFSMLLIPFHASAEGGYNTTYGTSGGYRRDTTSEKVVMLNPRPTIYSLSPDSSKDMISRTITIKGKGFVPASVARINGVDRPTTYIDSGHLLVKAIAEDMRQVEGGFYVTVRNPEPGGGFSNAEFFEVEKIVLTPTGSTVNDPNDFRDNTTGEDFSDLTATAIYGSNSFLPSGIVQWVLFAIIILLLVIMARKLFGAEEKYHSAPLKHD